MGKKAKTAPGADRRVRLPGRAQLALLGILLFALVAWTFLPATANRFLYWDDSQYVTANPHVQGGLTWESIRWAFQSTRASNWHPLTWLSHMLDCQWFGLDPRGHHLSSVLLHALNAVLLFLVLQRMTGARWRSLFVAAAFGLHPLRVESVAWIAERKDVLSTWFWMLTLLAYARYAQERAKIAGPEKTNRAEATRAEARGSKRERRAAGAAPPAAVPGAPLPALYYSLALLSFALGLMSKPMLVTLPLALLLLDHWPLNRWNRRNAWRLVWEKVPFLLLSTASCALTFSIQKRTGAMELTAAAQPLTGRFENAAVSYCRYLGKIFWPENLAALYPVVNHWPDSAVLLSLVLLAAVSAGVLVLWRRRPYLATGWFWFLGTLVPTIGIVAVGDQAMADRYTYVPSIGVLLMVAWGVGDVARNWRHRAVASAAAAAATLVACIAVTRHDLGYWHDNETLFRRAIAVTSDNYRAHATLGSTLLRQRRVDDALQEFQEAVRLNPKSAEARVDLGMALGLKNRPDEAIAAFEAALRLRPNLPEAHFNLGVALEAVGQKEASLREFEEAARLQPNLRNYLRLGLVLARNGRLDDAITQFQQAVRIDPKSVTARVGLGNALSQQGRLEEATAQFSEALRIDPANVAARRGLDAVREEQGH
jgi:tetratricopeptide (TPR) repeat protein